MKRFALATALLIAACSRVESSTSKSPPFGDAARGKEIMTQYGCNVCHSVPGIEGPQGSLAPALAGVASRPTISKGTVQTTPENLMHFIQSPPSMNPTSMMPPTGLSDADARDVAAYLLTLK